MHFDYPITLSTQLILPSIFFGVLLVGSIISFYIYITTKDKLYLATALFQTLACIFSGSESLVILYGGVLYLRDISVQFHRIEQLAGAAFIVAIPFLLSQISKETFPQGTKAFLALGTTIFMGIVLMAFVDPNSFVSIENYKVIGLTKEAEYGRGQEGPLYLFRDIYILFVIIFTLLFTLNTVREQRVSKLSYWMFIGLSISFFLTFLDILNVYTDYKTEIPRALDFSYAALGLCMFATSTMLGVFQLFFETLQHRETSLHKVQTLAQVGGVEWNRTSGKLLLSQELLASFKIPENHKSGAVQAYVSNHFVKEDQARFIDYLDRCSKETITQPETFRFRSRGNAIMWALFTPPEILSSQPNGEPDRLLWSVQNVSAHHQLEEQLRHSQKMEAVGQLAGGIAHDFNNMLGGIRGAAELLQKTIHVDDFPRQSYTQLILDTTLRASELTRHLLNFSRKGAIERVPLDMNEVLTNALAILQCTMNKRITIHASRGALNSYVLGDATLLENILLNMGINAAHAMYNGGTLTITLENHLITEEECQASTFALTPGYYVQVVINDTGTGIAPEHLSKIFEPFFTTKDLGEGTGLGLSAVYGIIQAHGGAIRVASEPGKGTTFFIDLPTTDSRPEPKSAPSLPLAPIQGTILIVDDEPVVRFTTTTILQKMGFTVLTASHGAEGVELFKKHYHEISLVILDYIMPEMDGVSCFRAMKKIAPDMQIILSSGYTGQMDVTSLKEEGLHAFISKPYGHDELLQVMRAPITCS